MHQSSRHMSHTAPATEGKTIRWARYYDAFVRPLTFGREKALRAETIQRAAIQAGETVLDVGCGTGTLTLLAKTAGGYQSNVYGLDASPEMIDAARRKAVQQQQEVDFRIGVIESLPFPDSTFDVVLSSLMYHHLPGDLKRLGLEEIYRVLKPGGRLLIVDMKRPTHPSHSMPLVMLVHHAMSSGVDDLRPLMEKVGYAALESGDMQWKPLGFIQGQRAP
jgi:ubiquinone/menaquinone biosynthesis C-methylase UbiE